MAILALSNYVELKFVELKLLIAWILALLFLEGDHTEKSYYSGNYTHKNEDGYTQTPIMKIIATFQKWTTATYQPHSLIPAT
jgi:hypothetical protein